MEPRYIKIPHKVILTPKIIHCNSNGPINPKKSFYDFPKSAKFQGSNNTISDYYTNKTNNPNSLFFPTKKLKVFSSRGNLTKQDCSDFFKKNSIRPKSNSYKKVLPNLLNNKSIKENRFGLETEQLYQETYQIKKVIKNLEKQLNTLSYENYVKDRQLILKEEEINKIINKTMKNNYMKNVVISDDINNISMKINNNTAFGVLISRIKKEIRNTENEIKFQTEKCNILKRQNYMTKSNELTIESDLLKEQLGKINSLIENSLLIKNENEQRFQDLLNLRENISRQNIIISNLEKENFDLQNEENFLHNQMLLLRKELKNKIEQAKINDNELNSLFLKNKNLNNDEIIKSHEYIMKENDSLITVKSSYSIKISQLKKNINFYKGQIKNSDELLNKLKEQRKKLMEANKGFDSKLKINQNFIENPSKIKGMNRPISSIGERKQNIKEEDIINRLKIEFKSSKKEEMNLEQRFKMYLEKIKEIDATREENSQNQNQMEFGIDENNPYYSDDEDNIPEKTLKFTSSQFNQFTYILFKNFEAKYIVQEEANTKIMNPFIEIINNYNNIKIQHPSEEFDNLTEQLTKVIMDVLGTENESNHILIKLFLGALLYNSDCDTNKLIEYFSVLFNYTKSYTSIEKKLIQKLKTKYKDETKKLVDCITSYIINEQSPSQYFTLFKMKDLLDKNEIVLKDKYIEFLFYFMKKFDDPNSKLEDLKYSLLNEIIPLGDTTKQTNAINGEEAKKENEDINEENENENSEEDEKNDIEEQKVDDKGEEVEKEENIKIEKETNKDNNIQKSENKIEDNNLYNKDFMEDKKKKETKGKKIDFNDNNSAFKVKQELENIDNNINSKEKEPENKKEKKLENDGENKTEKQNNIDIKSDIKNEKKTEEEEKKSKEDNTNSKNNNYNSEINNHPKISNNENKNIFNEITDKELPKNDQGEEKKENKTQEEKEDKKEEEFEIRKNENEDVKKSSETKKEERENEEDSITEITNEEYNKQILISINMIQNTLKENDINFNSLVSDVLNKIKINGEEYEYINIEDLNDKLFGLGLNLTDLQLSCLCSKYCIPNELRFIDKKKFEKHLEENSKGILKLE